jgi:dTMP kinase
VRGRYVVLEGGEGVGKTTQAALLVERLAEAGVAARVVREPGGDPFAEAGRELLLGDLPREPEAEVLLFNALRVQLLVGTVRPLLAAGTWVVSDRSSLSTVVYQGHGHGVDLTWTREVCASARSRCEPDLEVVLALDEATARARRTDRGVTDRFERMDEGFHARVAEGYRVEAAERGLPVVEASGSPDEVAARIWPHLDPLR